MTNAIGLEPCGGVDVDIDDWPDCDNCAGTGEGPYDTACPVCGGCGVGPRSLRSANYDDSPPYDD